MAAKRETELYFKGGLNIHGRPRRYVEGIPARDLSEPDIRLLSDEQYAAVQASGLYDTSKPKGRDSQESDDPEETVTPTEEGQTVAEAEAAQAETEAAKTAETEAKESAAAERRSTRRR